MDRFLQLNPAFAAVLPKLTDEEFAQLESNLLRDGRCLEDIVAWSRDGSILDGYHRYELCLRHGLGYNTRYVDLTDEAACVEWIKLNQLGRRNLPLAYRASIAVAYKAKLEEQQAESPAIPESAPAVSIEEQAAEVAGVSRTTLRRVEEVEQSGVPELVQAVVLDRTISPAAGAEIAQLTPSKQVEKVRVRVAGKQRSVVPAVTAEEQNAAEWLDVVYAVDRLYSVLKKSGCLDSHDSPVPERIGVLAQLGRQRSDGAFVTWLSRSAVVASALEVIHNDRIV